MYEAFFQLRQRPFTASPQPDRFFPGQAIESARNTFSRIIDRAEGVGLVIGAAGTGKTLLCQALAKEFRERLTVALLSSGRLCTRRALLQAILFELRLPYRGLEEGELRLSLIDHLTPERGGHPGLLLFVDEAHTLPLRLLEELRMITNLVRDGESRVRLVLAGGPALEERFASPKLESFSQRVAARCYLGSLNREETAEYVRYQITAAGGNPGKVFEPAAYSSIYAATDGVPRLVNQVCDHALILSALGDRQPVTVAVVEEAWGDLQQLPVPWPSASADHNPAASIVEFASLDAPTEPSPAIPFRAAGTSLRPVSPDEQLDEIDRQLAELDDDFQPAGSIGPEIELVFPETTHPFGDAFDEEEVVLDRYASLEADLFAQRPQVKSREGSELSELLDPWMNKSPEPTLSMDRAAQPTDAPWRQAERIATPAARAVRAEPDRDHVLGEVGSSSARDANLTSIHIEQQSAVYDAADEDADLIIIEDDAANLSEAGPPAPLVRRQEYRQLFARMRRG